MRDGDRWRASAALALLVAGVATLVGARPLPILIAQAAEPKGAAPPATQAPPSVPVAPGTAEPSPPAAAAVNEEEQQTIALLVDLQRYSAESNEELRRE